MSSVARTCPCTPTARPPDPAAIREPGEALAKRGFEVIQLPVDEQGLVDPASLAALLDDEAEAVELAVAEGLGELGELGLAGLALAGHEQALAGLVDGGAAASRRSSRGIGRSQRSTHSRL